MTIMSASDIARACYPKADPHNDTDCIQVGAALYGAAKMRDEIAAALRAALDGVTITASAVEVDGERLCRVSRDPMPALRRLLAELGGEAVEGEAGAPLDHDPHVEHVHKTKRRGTCADCPRRNRVPHPAACKYADRYDHAVFDKPKDGDCGSPCAVCIAAGRAPAPVVDREVLEAARKVGSHE